MIAVAIAKVTCVAAVGNATVASRTGTLKFRRIGHGVSSLICLGTAVA